MERPMAEPAPAATILVADDDPGHRLLLEQALARAGVVVRFVADGAAALAAAADCRPDLILLDIDMPGLDGIETCRRLRAHLAGRCPPIIMVASHGGNEAITEAFAVGATDYLIKPLNWTLLRHRVRGWLAAGAEAAGAAAARTLVVSRRGQVLADSRGVSGAPRAGTSLAELFEPALVQHLLTGVRKALKSREPVRLQFGSSHIEVTATGREQARLTVTSGEAAAADAGELFRLAYLDQITGLPNRHLFERTAAAALVQARLHETGLALLCVIVDPLPRLPTDGPEFRQLGRSLADALVARLRDADHLVRYDQSGVAPGPVASADSLHFLLLLANTGPEAVPAVMRRVAATCDAVTETLGRPVPLRPRFGVARFPEDATSVPALMDCALGAANLAGYGDEPGRPAAAPRTPGQADLASELRQALARGAVSLYFQPRAELATGQVTGVEALLRWQDPLRGLLTGQAVLQLAEAAGVALALADWALATACQQAADWSRSLPVPPRVAVNTPARQLANPDFAADLVARLTALDLDPARIEIEVPESALGAGPGVVRQLVALCDAGIPLVIDDFDAGTASLAMLRRLRIDAFKIHVATLRAATEPGSAAADCGLIVSIARAQRAAVIVKCVESADDLALARARGCDQAQGFQLCQPLPGDALLEYLARTGHRQAAPI
jgi:EAL domain-containing protein (putative c-di-GMP-specific phosphodiesterase class I)/DNA-binding response OmpR family regulator/GGDEF domain-containing protein